MTQISWCVAHTQPSKEFVAQQHLKEQGFQVYLPRFKNVCRHARKVEEKLVPLFPRYVFVGMDLEHTRWRSVNGTRGVAHLLMSDDLTPAKVSKQVIEELRSQEIAEDVVLVASLATFTKGDKVRITDGAFNEHLATFDSLDDKERVRLLLTFMGREMTVTVPGYAVEAA